jgi:hypothetical protein
MNRRQAIQLLSGALLLSMLAGSGPAAAFRSGGLHDAPGWQLAARAGGIPWDALSREERKLLNKHRRNWADYPAEKQERLRHGVQRYLQLPPEKREHVERERRQYEKLTPEQRRQLREEYRRQQR